MSLGDSYRSICPPAEIMFLYFHIYIIYISITIAWLRMIQNNIHALMLIKNEIEPLSDMSVLLFLPLSTGNIHLMKMGCSFTVIVVLHFVSKNSSAAIGGVGVTQHKRVLLEQGSSQG